MAKPDAKKEWEARIADYSTTKLSDREWCAKHGVTEHQLRHWRSRLRKKPESSMWTAVQIVSEDTSGSKCGTIHIGSARIEVRPDFDQALLSAVLQVVAASC